MFHCMAMTYRVKNEKDDEKKHLSAKSLIVKTGGQSSLSCSPDTGGKDAV